MDYSILKNKTILVVDDEAIILKVASQFFIYYGSKVILASNGQEAIDLAHTQKPDLIIMDWKMPIVSGIEATKALKADSSTQNIPIIIATGISDSNELLHEAFACGADDYITKPLEQKVMIARAIAVLRLYDSIALTAHQNQALQEANNKIISSNEALKESSERYQKLYVKTPAMLFSLSSQLMIKEASHHWLEHMGYTREETIGSPISNFLQPINQLQSYKELDKSPFIASTKTGKKLDVLLSSSIEEGQDEFLVVMNDITARKSAESEIERYKEGLMTLKYITSDVTLEITTQLEKAMIFMLQYFDMELGILSDINDKDYHVLNAYNIDGIDRQFPHSDLLLSATICQFPYQEQQPIAITSLDESYSGQLQLMPNAKSYIGISYWVNDEKYGTICFLSSKEKLGGFQKNDLEFLQLFTRWVGFTIEKQRQTDNLIQTNNSKDRILATVAHDLRNPIQAIQGVTTILKLQLKDASAQDLEVISLINTSCTKALNLISELLESSEMENISYQLRKSPTAIDIFIHRTLKLFEQQIREKKLHLKLNLQCEDIYAEINHQKFTRVIENLVSNAIKFTPEDGTITISTKNIVNSIQIEISDTGIGVPLALQPVIFDKFSKAGRSGLKGEKSTGLGMYIVKQIVELHEGEITLISNEGQGATFNIKLPYSDNDE